ncbi:MAG: aldehyde ferredoxin oxidoreductase family protein [Chloroflexi bacterium]|nr:aldehyde ferredoxin oxidoreductase family protein [Chloroflexota bacterium]
MPSGYHGKVLRVDLTTGKIDVETPDAQFFRRYLGGSALASYYLLRELEPGVDPLGPDNVLVFAGGVITGTAVAGSSRYTVAAKSPLTGGFGEAEAGGWWGPEFKMAGFDAIVVKGRAPKPVYLWVKDGQAELRDASAIWGLPQSEAQDAIRAELGEPRARVAQIGPAGERLVRYACVINELKHANGRTGMGAVMGAKNLRAVAVRGTAGVEAVDKDAAREVARWVNRTYVPDTMRTIGTSRGLRGLNAGGMLPTRNFKDGSFEGAEQICGEAQRDTILVDVGTCFACPIRCKREVEVKEPYQVDRKYGGPEYETIGAFGSLCGIDDLKPIAYANQLCNAYGLDTISTGNCIAFAMECFDNGILTKEDTDGLDLRFGNAEAMLKMVEMIIERRGLGDVLAEGVQLAAARIGKGAEKYAMHVKGQELPMHEPRGKPAGAGLAYAVSPTGADHMEAQHDPLFEREDMPNYVKTRALGLLEPLPQLDLSPRKARQFFYLQTLWGLYNSLTMCAFVGAPAGPFALGKIVDFVNAVTGWDTSLWELMKVGERSNTMQRVFNLREGFTAKDDSLPERFFQGLGNGALQGRGLGREEFSQALHAYYGMAGWDEETGVPRRWKLDELSIGWTAEYLPE